MKKLLLTLLMSVPMLLSAQDIGGDYYVAVGGDDSGPGTYDRPWGTWQKAFSTAKAGETVYFRGGVWYPQDHSRGNTIVEIHTGDGIGHSGTADNPIRFFNYPGENPVLDCSQVDMTGNRFNGALSFSDTHYIHLRGLTIRNVQQPESGELASGVGASSCSNMTFENLTVHDVGGRGMSYWGVAGHPQVPEIKTDTTRYINCDVYNCIDLLSSVPGNGSDGWKLDNESAGYLYFYGCRSWNCGDDGFDISGPGLTIFDNCWSFGHNMPGALDGNGFKFGANRGHGATQDSEGHTHVGPNVPGVRKIVQNCIAAGNAGFGFYELAYAPYYPNQARFYNNVAYANGIGISIYVNDDYEGVNPSIYKNNIVYKPVERDAGGRPYKLSVTNTYIASHNNWEFADNNTVGSLPWWQPSTVTVSDNDFVSLDMSQLSRPRKADGSLPDITFMKPAPGSDLIDAGTDVGLPFYGNAPDIGYAEYRPDNYQPLEITDYSPNKTVDIVSVTYYSPEEGSVSLTVVNETGTQFISTNHQATIGQNNTVEVDLSGLPAGAYTVRLSDGNSTTSCSVTKIPGDIDVAFKIIKNFPNPTVGLFAIQFTCAETANIAVTVSDETGETVMSDFYAAKPDINKMVLNLAPLEKGNYRISLNNNGEIISTAVTKQ
ncbi:Por secretion system C-terminal sorting domain-containing protein [Saccharicrinis carchari]|uniref:Por secretion system C-terminal sorting domain-containing protein n=1 Tax=Saccharicrinis carchari TaxID=1168039 RepID=A0A521BUG8_SACCC|nr:T9SS type A sorting domain-containing protein [Saccharicrinis carchari]SMO50796.1 Por secretion system C-terminal sorting domain-containing protein [Saccharicrinis carchari]